MKRIINPGLVPPPNTPRSVTMLPTSKEAPAFVVTDDAPVYRLPTPHYQEFLDAAKRQITEAKAQQNSAQSQSTSSAASASTAPQKQREVIYTTKANISPGMQRLLERIELRRQEANISAKSHARS